MSILVFGKTGQVARELASFSDLTCLDRTQADLSRAEDCAKLIEEIKPKAVINAAAYTNVDQAEEEKSLANLVNGYALLHIASVCARDGIPLLQLSTDYVFNGRGEAPWTPGMRTDPLSVYGQSKWAGEEHVFYPNGPHVILRTSWVFSAHGKNFVKTMLRLGAERSELRVVDDQIGGPTAARDIASACHSIIHQLMDDPKKSGTYHFTGAPDCSWADFARAIFDLAGLDCEVTGIPTSDYPTPATRPLNSRLDCTATEDRFGVVRPHWRDSLAQVLQDLGGAA